MYVLPPDPPPPPTFGARIHSRSYPFGSWPPWILY
jgi:hypothetical protein